VPANLKSLRLDNATDEDEHHLPRGSKKETWKTGVTTLDNGISRHKKGGPKPFKASIVAAEVTLCNVVPTLSGASIEAIFDQVASKLKTGRDGRTIDNLSGQIPWGIACELDALPDMYLATGKEEYLAGSFHCVTLSPRSGRTR
jgi:hypothetical protein